MLNQRLTVARTITTNLIGLERQIDDALVMHGQLQIALIEGRRSANLPLDAGQGGLDKVTEAAASLVAARKAMNEAHYAFRAVRDQLRLPVHAYGDTGDSPDQFSPSATLALVGAA